MMKIKLMALALALVALPAVADNYLYWMVELGGQEETEYPFYYATVSMDGTLLSNQASGMEIGAPVYTDSWPNIGTTTSEVYAHWTGGIGSTFLFELYSENGTMLANKSVSYADLSSCIGTGTMSQAALYTATGFTAVPEPTSGLLMLLGLAGLALKRKRA